MTDTGEDAEPSEADERFVQHMRNLLYVRRDWSFDRRSRVEPYEILASVKSLGWVPPMDDIGRNEES